METIKLRMWNNASKSYLYDIDNVFECLKQQHKFDGTMPDRGFVNAWDHKSEGMIWEMFTTLFDINKNPIYEGDICIVTYYNHSTPDTKMIQRVVFVDGGFALMSKKCTSEQIIEDDRNFVPLYYSHRPNKIEVIGNINENPELL